MKKLTLVVFALVLGLAVGAVFAATAPQTEPVVTLQDPPATPVAEEPLPDLADLLQALAPESAEALPQDNPPCSATMICEPCPNGDARLCRVMVCGSQKTKSCGQCVPNCTTEF